MISVSRMTPTQRLIVGAAGIGTAFLNACSSKTGTITAQPAQSTTSSEVVATTQNPFPATTLPTANAIQGFVACGPNAQELVDNPDASLDEGANIRFAFTSDLDTTVEWSGLGVFAADDSEPAITQDIGDDGIRRGTAILKKGEAIDVIPLEEQIPLFNGHSAYTANVPDGKDAQEGHLQVSALKPTDEGVYGSVVVMDGSIAVVVNEADRKAPMLPSNGQSDSDIDNQWSAVNINGDPSRIGFVSTIQPGESTLAAFDTTFSTTCATKFFGLS